MNILDDNEIEDLDSSADPALDAKAPVSQEPAKPDDAASSPATGETEDSLLDVVRDVVDESRKPQTASPAEGEEVDGQSADAKPSKEPDNEDYSDVPFHKHPRFQHLLGKVKTFKVAAERYQNVQTFLDRNALSAEEAADGMIIMSLMKTNPVEAWKRLKPRVQNLLVAAGEVLPEDLRQRVDKGEMSRDAAMDVSRSRAAVASTETLRSFEQQRDQRDRETGAETGLKDEANAWEEDRRRKDPNFDTKMVPLHKEVLYLQQTEGKPTTPQGVREQLQKAYKAVNDTLKPATPIPPANRRPALKPVTGGQVAGGQKPDTMSTLDIVRANRRTG